MKRLFVILASLALAAAATRNSRIEEMARWVNTRSMCAQGQSMSPEELNAVIVKRRLTTSDEKNLAYCLFRSVHVIDESGRYNKSALYEALWNVWEQTPPQGQAAKRIAECCGREVEGTMRLTTATVLWACMMRRFTERFAVLGRPLNSQQEG